MPGNRRMEKGMKEIHKFLAEHTTEDMSMDEINALLNEHLKENQKDHHSRRGLALRNLRQRKRRRPRMT